MRGLVLVRAHRHGRLTMMFNRDRFCKTSEAGVARGEGRGREGAVVPVEG